VSAIFSLFTQGVSLGFSAAVSPGPFQAFLLSRAARVGVRRALPLALAPLVSDGPVVVTVLLVLTAAPPVLLRGLEVGGGLLLLWLALGAWRTAGEAGPEAPVGREDPRGSFLRAALVNAAGPGPWVFWSTICGPILLEAWRASPARGVAFLAGFYLVLVGGNAALVAAFGMAGRIGPRAARGLVRTSALLMAGMGALQLWRGLSGR
jgi:threonine/homoserine/homoserine lactone efflux protein